ENGRPIQRRDGTGYYHVADEKAAFSAAWNHHMKVNPHHHQFWLLVKDGGAVVPLRMSRKFVLEMVADWRGAGRAQGDAGHGEVVRGERGEDGAPRGDAPRGRGAAGCGAERPSPMIDTQGGRVEKIS